MNESGSGDRLVAGRYRLLASLGTGGMGTVWVADDLLLGRQVAVKEVIPPPDVTDAENTTLRERTLHEARTAARLSHPNVVTVYDVAEDGGRPWIVMELIQARSLRDIVLEDGPLPVQQAAGVGLQVLAALRAAHQLGIVHRDVKPGNVLIDDSGRAVLADFGIARAADTPAFTTTGVLVGSPSYIAPERAQGEQGGPASDLWSLGATLYAAVEGRPPYDRDGALPTLTAVVSEEPDPPQRAGPLWPVISGLLRHDPRERLSPGEAEAMLASAARAPSSTVPFPEMSAATAPDVSTAGARDSAPALARAERTLTVHPAAAAAASQPAAGSPAPASAGLTGAAAAESPPAPPPAPIQAQSVRPRPQPPPVRARQRQRSAWLAAAGAAAALGVALLLAFSLPGWLQPGGARPHRSGVGAPAARHSGSSTPVPTSGAGQATGAAGPGATQQPGSGTAAAVPAGYHRYQDPTGFSIAVPNGWQISHQGHYVYARDPASSRFLLIDQSSHPKPDPLADWRQQEANRISTYPAYHRIRLAAIRYPQAERAADWEFTYNGQGGPTHVLNRNILANSRHAYALYWSTPASDWTRSWHIFQVLAATFQPAPA